ncbi:MAG: hypothetical protein AAGD35_21585 [Actinomycetota bacterium]
MTVAIALPRPSTGTRSGARPASRRPRLQVLDQAAIRRRARRRNLAVVLFIVLLAGLFGVAMVHAGLVESQQELDTLRTRIAELEAERAQIEREVDAAASPARIVARAEAMGMVRAAEPVYLQPTRDIDDG